MVLLRESIRTIWLGRGGSRQCGDSKLRQIPHQFIVPIIYSIMANFSACACGVPWMGATVLSAFTVTVECFMAMYQYLHDGGTEVFILHKHHLSRGV